MNSPVSRNDSPPGSATITIRPARREDFPEFLRLKSEPLNIYWSGHSAKPDPEVLKRWYVDALDERFILFAELAGGIVGYSYIVPEADSVETAVGVAEAMTRRGLGTRIIALTAEWAARHFPGRPINAWIYRQNTASVRAHEAAGYRRCSGIERAVAGRAPDLIGGVQQCWMFRG